MSSVLSSFFSRDPKTAFAFELPNDSFTTIQQTIFVGKSFKKAEPTEKATCFWSASPESSLKAQARKLKTLRHPNVLTFIDSLEVDNAFYLITEPCRPLEYYLDQNKLTDTQRELLVSWGLYQVLNCLKFLHNEAKISHNNLKNAIFVTDSGDWKLATFHQTCNFSTPQTDLNELGTMLCRIFQQNPSAQLPKRVQPLYRRLNARGKSIMAVSDILNECRSIGGFMKNKFVDTLLFLDEFQIRDASEKQSFFMQLNSNLDLFPDDISRNKILPRLIHTYEYGDAGAHILVPMFKLGRLLEEDEYQQRVVPCLVKLFSSTDRTTRVKLLERIDEFASHLKSQVVNDKIYGNLVTGFMDSNSAVRESTVKAMVSFADKLNYNNLNTNLMKYLARLQGSDPEPSIRTNTTICLGKLGCYIDPSHRQRILISAFTRALKDPFPPARIAGVLALSATQQFYSLTEVAQKVLPALAPLAVDPEKQVRDQSFKAMSGFVEKLKKASDNPELIPELEAQVKAGGKVGLLSGDKVPQWAGWAIKAISGKFYKSTNVTTTADQPQQIGGAQQQSSDEGLSNKSSMDQTHKKSTEMESTLTGFRKETSSAGGLPPRVGSFSSSHSSTKGTSSSVIYGWSELTDDEENGEEEKKQKKGEDGTETEDGSDYGEKLAKREDALWGAAMDEWESAERETATPSPKMGTIKLNSPFSIGSSASPAPQERKDRSFSPSTSQLKTKAKLGAMKKVQPISQQRDPLDLLLDLNTDFEQNKTEEDNTGGVGIKKIAIDKKTTMPQKVSTAAGGGNFVSAATQIKKKAREEKTNDNDNKKTEENNWQNW